MTVDVYSDTYSDVYAGVAGAPAQTVLGQAWYYGNPTTLLRYTGPGGGGGGGNPPPPPGPWDPTQVVSQPRPSGTGYVTYESLWVAGDTLSDVAAKVPLDGSGKPQYLTLPAGVFEVTGFDQGYYDGLRLGSGGAVGCRGIIGSGNGAADTIIRPKANSATRLKPTNIVAPAGLAGTVIRVEGCSGAQFSNFRMEGTQQTVSGLDLMYNGLMLGSCPDSTVSWIKGYGMNHGNKNAPDGETFGVSFYKSDRATLHDCDLDGRLPNGTRWSSSGFGWNGAGLNNTQRPGAPITDARVLRVRCMYQVAGMPTFWHTYNIYTEDLWSIGNGTGSGGLQGHAINHEQSWGHIEHHRPVMKPKSTQGREPDKTANTGTHFTLINDSYDPGVDFAMYEPVWDTNFGTTGMLIMGGYDAYSSGIDGGDGTNNLTAVPKVIKNGVQLGYGPITHPAAGWANQDATKYFARIH